MDTLITVKPGPHKRGLMALWLVSEHPSVRTVSESEFGIPPAVFTLMPEELLTGAIVDGHEYVSPDLDPVQVSEAEPPHPPVSDSRPEMTPEPEPNAEVDPLEAPQSTTISGLFLCEDCDKTSTSAAGLAAHRRAKHSG